MNKFLFFCLCFLFVSIFNGCTPLEKENIKFAYQYIPFTSVLYDKVSKDEIVIYNSIKDIPNKYEEIGVFKFSGDEDYDILKNAASEHGGNGLLRTTRGIILIRFFGSDKTKGNNDATI